MIFVSPSYRKYPIVGKPYTRDDKLYIHVNKDGVEKEVRAYEDWQTSWGTKDMPQVKYENGVYTAYNYPEGYYAKLIGITEAPDGRRGIYKYNKCPPYPCFFAEERNLYWTPAFGWFGKANEEPRNDLNPVFMDEELDLKVGHDSYKRINKYINTIEEWKANGYKV